jgi:hypothetical protein
MSVPRFPDIRKDIPGNNDFIFREIKPKNLTSTVLCFIISLFLLASCAFQLTNENPSSNASQNLNTPYASVQELDSITNGSSDYAYWRLSRVFALMQLENFRSQCNWNNTALSERPVVIYDGQFFPKYYEFRVCLDGKEIGAISCIAQKKDGQPVAYVMSYAKDYSQSSSLGKNYKIIANNYPASIYYGVQNEAPNKLGIMNNVVFDPQSGHATNAAREVSALELLRNADNATLSNIGITNESQRQEMIQDQLSNQSANHDMWQQIEQRQSNIIQTTVEQVAQAAVSTKGDWDDQYILWQWWNKAYYYNPGLWCGPNCLTFISIGAGYYPGYGIDMGNNRQAIDDAYLTFENAVGTGAKLWWDFSEPLQRYTPFTLIGGVPHTYDIANGFIRDFGTPVISLRSWAFINGIWTWEWHYRVICGTLRQHREWGFWFLWWWIGFSSNKDWYLMHDNGEDGGNFWEAAGSSAQIVAYPTVRYTTGTSTGLSVNYAGNCYSILSWNSLPGASSYEIYYSRISGDAAKASPPKAVTSVNTFGFSLDNNSGIPSPQTWYFTIKATIRGEKSAFSDVYIYRVN